MRVTKLDPHEDPHFNKRGELKQPVRFQGAEACGAPAIVSYTENGVRHHRCTAHMPRAPKRGPSQDPLSIGGSERYRYKM